uniref:Uncharacterized protein n=1 Tax=Anguilla anguilla TaxID=7936 RepID=A0A0E9RMV4_ANGAN
MVPFFLVKVQLCTFKGQCHSDKQLYLSR